MKEPAIDTLIFVPTGSYNPMGTRPYTARATGETLDALDRATDGFRNLTTGSLAGIAGRIIRPSTFTTGQISIDQGWDAQRLMFMMKVVYPNNASLGDFGDDDAQRVQYVSGFTDHSGDASYTGILDPRMKMYINTVISTREVVRSNRRTSRLLDANRFLQQNAGFGSRSSVVPYALRPRDVVQAVGNRSLGEPVESDFRTSLSSRPLFSSIRNELPSDYMYRTLSAFRMGMNSNRYSHNDEPSVMSEVASNTGDEANIHDAFMMSLTQATELAEGMYFTYGEFCRLFRGVDEQAHVADPPKMVRDIGFAQHQAKDTADWNGSDNETVVASILASAVPASMVDAMLTQCAFTATNDTINGLPEFHWHSAPMSFMLQGEDLSQQMIHFEDHFLRETFRDVTNNGLLTLSLSVHSDLVMTDTRMEITIDGDHPVPFCMPNFASSLTTPVLANSRDQLDDMAGSIRKVFDEMQPDAVSHLGEPNDVDDNFRIGSSGSVGSALRERDRSQDKDRWSI